MCMHELLRFVWRVTEPVTAYIAICMHGAGKSIIGWLTYSWLTTYVTKPTIISPGEGFHHVELILATITV